MADRDGAGWYEKAVFIRLLVCQGLPNHDGGVARGIVFREIQPGAGF